MSRVKFDMEFIFRASPAIIYKFLTAPSCLIRWFCDGVDINGEQYSFTWLGFTENAEMLDDIEEERIKFRWLDADHEDEFFEFRMYKSPITEETILELTDFCDEDELEDQKELWTNQMNRLRKEMGG